MKLNLIVVALGAVIVGATNPGVVVQINQSFLTYIKDVGLQLLSSTVAGNKIPDEDGDLGHHISYKMSNIKVEKFSAPSDKNTITLAPPHGLKSSILEISVAIKMDYRLEEKIAFIHTHQSGSVDASADATATVNTQIIDKDGRPQLSITECHGNIGDVHLEFHGGIFSHILDLFKHTIEKKVQGSLGGIICKEVESIVTGKANPMLAGIAIDTELLKGFYVDYALTNSASIVGQTIEAPFVGKIYYQGHENDAGIPQAKAMAPVTGVNKHLCFKLQVEEVIGSAAYAGIKSGLLHKSIVLADLNAAKLSSNLLKCNCGTGAQCLVSYFPGLATQCPSGQELTLDISMSAMPTVKTSGFDIGITFTGEIQVKLGSVSFVTLEAVGTADIKATDVSLDGWTLKGKLEAIAGHLKVTAQNHAIGGIAGTVLDDLWKDVVVYIFNSQVNTLGSSGIKLPAVPGITLGDAYIKMSNGNLAVCDDITVHI